VEECAYFKEADGIGYVRAVGHMTALLCPLLKARIQASLDSPRPPERIVFDLTQCEYMDSTFLGLIVGIGKRLAARSGSKPLLYGTNQACMGLLRTIGVLGLVEISPRQAPAVEGMERISDSAAPTARFILDAHEDLSALSAENRSRFATLAAALRKVLGEEDKA
jgi:anti-anti-sigma factor